MGLDNLVKENLSDISDESVANRILQNADVDYEDVPIKIEAVLQNLGFKIGVISEFKNSQVVAGIAYSQEKISSLNSDKYFIFKRNMDVQQRRYAMSVAICMFVVESGGSYFNKTIRDYDLDASKVERAHRIARAVLMPQKSLSTLILSPLVSKLTVNEKIEYVAKAFLVSRDVARQRIEETGM